MRSAVAADHADLTAVQELARRLETYAGSGGHFFKRWVRPFHAPSSSRVPASPLLARVRRTFGQEYAAAPRVSMGVVKNLFRETGTRTGGPIPRPGDGGKGLRRRPGTDVGAIASERSSGSVSVPPWARGSPARAWTGPAGLAS